LALSLVACGHNENEWQAQLAKYSELSQQSDKERAAHDEDKKALEEQRQLVLQLKEQLEKMGVDLSSLSQQLEQTGSQNKTLAKNLEEVNRALKEYQERAAQLERITELLDDLEGKQEISRLLDSAAAGDATRIFIGAENQLFSLSGSSVIAKPFHGAGGRVVGVVGVIGPTRLNYARVVPMVDFTAATLARLMS